MLSASRETALMTACLLALLAGLGWALCCRMQERRRMAVGVLIGTLLGTMGLLAMLVTRIIGGAIRG